MVILGSSSATRGIISGGKLQELDYTVIEYITIASKGNSIWSFGEKDLSWNDAGASNATRGIFAGGEHLMVLIFNNQLIM